MATSKREVKTFAKQIASLDGSAVQFPVKYMPDDITTAVEAAQSTAEAAQSTAEAAQSTAEAAQSTADEAFRIYQQTEDVTISIPQLKGSVASATQIDGANIAYGSVITISNGKYSGSAIWNGESVNINTRNSIGGSGPIIQIVLTPSGKYTIKNTTLSTIFAESTLTYKKVNIPTGSVYSLSSGGAWLPPYIACSCIYIAGQTSGSASPIYKITVDSTGALQATKVTT